MFSARCTTNIGSIKSQPEVGSTFCGAQQVSLPISAAFYDVSARRWKSRIYELLTDYLSTQIPSPPGQGKLVFMDTSREKFTSSSNYIRASLK